MIKKMIVLSVVLCTPGILSAAEAPEESARVAEARVADFPESFASDKAFHDYLLSRADVQEAMKTPDPSPLGGMILTEEHVKALPASKSHIVRRDLMSGETLIHFSIQLRNPALWGDMTLGDFFFPMRTGNKQKQPNKRSGCFSCFKRKKKSSDSTSAVELSPETALTAALRTPPSSEIGPAK